MSAEMGDTTLIDLFINWLRYRMLARAAARNQKELADAEIEYRARLDRIIAHAYEADHPQEPTEVVLSRDNVRWLRRNSPATRAAAIRARNVDDLAWRRITGRWSG